MKAVGEAVAEGQTFTWDRFGMTHTLRCIGIAPWGYVEKAKEWLVEKKGEVSMDNVHLSVYFKVLNPYRARKVPDNCAFSSVSAL